jgi:hypothetical protein
VAGVLPSLSLLAVLKAAVDLAATLIETATVDNLEAVEAAETLVQETDNGVMASMFQDLPMLDSSAISSVLPTTR